VLVTTGSGRPRSAGNRSVVAYVDFCMQPAAAMMTSRRARWTRDGVARRV